MGTIEKAEVPEYLCGENQWETEANVELFQAAQKGDIERLKKALSNGANPNYFSNQRDGTLHAASRNASGEAALCARELVQRGARVSAALISNRNTALHEAASVGGKVVVEVLLETSPSSTGLTNSYGNTPLHASAAAGKPEIVKLLLEHSADPNKTNHRG
jgi:ankyrin repeat protein